MSDEIYLDQLCEIERLLKTKSKKKHQEAMSMLQNLLDVGGSGIKGVFASFLSRQIIPSGYLSEGDDPDYWLQKAAEAGNVYSQRELGEKLLWTTVEGNMRFDYSRGIPWLIKAADAGCVRSMHRVGYYYLCGDEKNRNADFSKALEYLERAISLGSYNSADALGTEFELKNKHKESFDYYYRGAVSELEHAVQCCFSRVSHSCMGNVSQCYKFGDGVQKDIKKAYLWLYMCWCLDMLDKHSFLVSLALTKKSVAAKQEGRLDDVLAIREYQGLGDQRSKISRILGGQPQFKTFSPRVLAEVSGVALDYEYLDGLKNNSCLEYVLALKKECSTAGIAVEHLEDEIRNSLENGVICRDLIFSGS